MTHPDPIFRFESAVARDPRVDGWFSSRDPELAALARQWFEVLRRSGPDIRELIHDGCPVVCVGSVALAYVNVFKAHVSLGFFMGALLDDPSGLLEGAGKRMRHVKLHAGVGCDEAALQRLIEDAYVQASALI